MNQTASLKLASASISFAERGFTRRRTQRSTGRRRCAAVCDPVSQRGHVQLAFGHQRLAAKRARSTRRPGRLARAHDTTVFVDPHAHRHVDELKRRAHRMLGVDERRVGRLRRVVPFAGCRFTAGILRGRDDLEVAALQLGVEGLPTWQIEPAPSPGGPGDHQHLLAAELRERNGRPVRSGPRRPAQCAIRGTRHAAPASRSSSTLAPPVPRPSPDQSAPANAVRLK